jgi:hypothetical protein
MYSTTMTNIFLTPAEWEILTGVTILDPEGWNGEKDWEQSCTFDTFYEKSCASAVDNLMEKDKMRIMARLNIVSYV